MALRDPLNRPMRTRMSGGVAGASGRPLPLCRFRVDNFESVLGGGFVMMAVAFYAAAVFPMMTIMRRRLIGGLCLGETRTILWRLLHSGSLLHRTHEGHS